MHTWIVKIQLLTEKINKQKKLKRNRFVQVARAVLLEV
jgi:hypothetical protein